MKKDNDMVFVKKAAWDSLVASLKKFTPDFMEERIQPPSSVAKGCSKNSARGGKSRQTWIPKLKAFFRWRV